MKDTDNRVIVLILQAIRGWTTKIDSATRPFLKFDTATRPFLKFDMRHGHLSGKRQGYFLNSTGDMGLKTVSDMRQGYL